MQTASVAVWCGRGGYPMHGPFAAQIAPPPPVCAAAQVSVLTNDGKHYVVRVSMYMAAEAPPTACMRLALPARGAAAWLLMDDKKPSWHGMASSQGSLQHTAVQRRPCVLPASHATAIRNLASPPTGGTSMAPRCHAGGRMAHHAMPWHGMAWAQARCR